MYCGSCTDFPRVKQLASKATWVCILVRKSRNLAYFEAPQIQPTLSRTEGDWNQPGAIAYCPGVFRWVRFHQKVKEWIPGLWFWCIRSGSYLLSCIRRELSSTRLGSPESQRFYDVTFTCGGLQVLLVVENVPDELPRGALVSAWYGH